MKLFRLDTDGWQNEMWFDVYRATKMVGLWHKKPIWRKIGIFKTRVEAMKFMKDNHDLPVEYSAEALAQINDANRGYDLGHAHGYAAGFQDGVDAGSEACAVNHAANNVI